VRGEFRRYIVRDTRAEVPGVTTVSLSEEDGAVPPFSPGQYINVYFPETRTPEGKAYSVSSAPGEPTFSITVRAIGEFSNRLCAMRPGEAVSASLPYGFFCPERGDSDVAMLAAGIGVAPFRSIIRHAAAHLPSRRVSLFHSIRTWDDAIFREEFESLKKELPNFSITYFVTRGAAPPESGALPRRMTAKDVLAKISDAPSTEFLVCGSIPFTRDLWRDLRRAGVPEDQMYTEAFFSH